MHSYTFEMKLLRDTTFGRGDGVVGLVDEEVEHDRWGIPFMRGRTLKGLWSEACENLILVMREPAQHLFYPALDRLFGRPGGSIEAQGSIRVDNLSLPPTITNSLRQAIDQGILRYDEVLNSLTTIRRQTSIDSALGIAEESSLRAMRVITRELVFYSQIYIESMPTKTELALLTAGAKAVRYVGTSRNRGRGVVQCKFLIDATEQPVYFEHFKEVLNAKAGA